MSRIFQFGKTTRRLVACALVWCGSSVGYAIEVDGFTEPYRDIDVATSESGILTSIEVKEGDRVQVGQLLARLDETLLQATVAIAKSAMESQGRLQSAQAEVTMLSSIVSKLLELRERGHASQQEIQRAETKLTIAEAHLRTVQEESNVKALEYERVRVQVQQRRLTSPIDGIVTVIFKDQGEFVSSSEPMVIKVVQIDPLLVVFSVPAEYARQLAAGQMVELRIAEATTTSQGEVEFVSPTADPQSGTTRVRVRIPNPDERLPSGASCRLRLELSSEPLASSASQ